MSHPASVVRCEGDELLVRVDPPTCQRCQSGNGCGAGLLQGVARSVELKIPSPPQSRLQAGDTVALELERRWLLRGTLTLYGLPLASALAAVGLLTAASSSSTDGAAAAAAVVGLMAGSAAAAGIARSPRFRKALALTAVHAGENKA